MVGLVGGGGLPAFTIYQSLVKTRDARLEQFQKSPLIDKEVQYFLEKVGDVETVDDFLSDRRLMKVALSAFALEDELQYPARIKAILTEPLEDKDSLVNKLIDPRYKEIATFFDFAARGTSKLKLISFRNDVVDRFLTNEFEKDLGNQNPALREAEYFRRKIGGAENTFNILGDKVLRSVVTFTLGLPELIVLQSIDKQKALIDARVKIEKFQDPEFVEEFIQRFLIKRDADAIQNGGFGGPDSYVLQLFAGAGGRRSLFF